MALSLLVIKPAGGVLSAASPPTLIPKTAEHFARSHYVFSLKLPSRRRSGLRVYCSSEDSDVKTTTSFQHSSENGGLLPEIRPGNEFLGVETRSPFFPANIIRAPKLSLTDQGFLILAFIACTTTVAFTSLVVAAVPTLFAMRRAAISLSKLADTAREELPSTMAAIRLSGMEISDLTLELSDLSQEIADGVNKSAQAVQAAEAGIRQIGSLAHQQTMSIIQERANLPIISIQPVVAGAAKKTSRVVSQATKSFLNIISRAEPSSPGGDGGSTDMIES